MAYLLGGPRGRIGAAANLVGYAGPTSPWRTSSAADKVVHREDSRRTDTSFMKAATPRCRPRLCDPNLCRERPTSGECPDTARALPGSPEAALGFVEFDPLLTSTPPKLRTPLSPLTQLCRQVPNLFDITQMSTESHSYSDASIIGPTPPKRVRIHAKCGVHQPKTIRIASNIFLLLPASWLAGVLIVARAVPPDRQSGIAADAYIVLLMHTASS